MMTTTRKEKLLELFKLNTNNKVLIAPKVEPSQLQLVGYQYPRVSKYKWQGKV
jgi:hypothetical protein